MKKLKLFVGRGYFYFCSNCEKPFSEFDTVVFGETDNFGSVEVDRIKWMGLMHRDCYLSGSFKGKED